MFVKHVLSTDHSAKDEEHRDVIGKLCHEKLVAEWRNEAYTLL